MRDNITKVAERGERLDQLQDKTGVFLLPSGHGGVSATMAGLSCLHKNSSYLRTAVDNLAISAQGFRRGADRVRKVCPPLQILLFYLILTCSPRTCGKHWVQMLIDVPSLFSLFLSAPGGKI